MNRSFAFGLGVPRFGKCKPNLARRKWCSLSDLDLALFKRMDEAAEKVSGGPPGRRKRARLEPCLVSCSEVISEGIQPQKR